MTRKTIAITIPGAAEAPAPNPPTARREKKPAAEPAGVDSWVSQSAPAAATPPAPAPEAPGFSLHYQLSPTPNLAEATKILFILPQAALLYWTLAAAKRSLTIATSFSRNG